MKNKNFKQLKNFAKIGGISSFLILGLSACNDNSNSNQSNVNASVSQAQQQGAFVVIEQDSSGKYTIADEFPASKTTIVLRDPSGNERILSQEEINRLVKEEEAKIDAGTSPLTNPELSSGGMGLGGVLLSSIAGAMIGSWLGNKLFNNQNFQNQKKAQYKSPQTYSKSQNSFNNRANSSAPAKKSGFFGQNNQNSQSSNRSSNNSRFGG